MVYRIQQFLLLSAITLSGFRNYIFGYEIPFEWSTILIFILLLVQLLSRSLHISKLFIWINIIVVFQSFILNPSNMINISVLRHFIILDIYILSISSFIIKNQTKLLLFIKNYIHLIYFIALFSIFQMLIFVVTGVSIIPQNIVAGVSVISGRMDSFNSEIFNLLPRSIGLFTEPANFSFILFPGVFVAANKMLGRDYFNLSNGQAFVFMVAMGLTFSVVAYWGILLSLIYVIFQINIKERRMIKKYVLTGVTFFAFVYLANNSNVITKGESFIEISKEARSGKIMTHSYTSYAIISNLKIAFASQVDYNFLGSGLNTHYENYLKYSNTEIHIKDIYYGLNAAGAGSIFIRILSEFGLVGLMIFLVFCIRHTVFTKTPSGIVTLNHLSTLAVIHFSTRSGHYVNIIFILFLSLLYITKQMVKTKKRI